MPLDGSSHPAGSNDEAFGRPPVMYWVPPPSGDTATTKERGGTEGIPEVLMAAAVGLMAISTGTNDPLLVLDDPAPSAPVRPPPACELANGQYPTVPDPGPRTVTCPGTLAPDPIQEGLVQPVPSKVLFV